MEFEVLGPVRVRRGDASAARSGTMQRTLLGVLLTRANQPVPVDVLTETLWPGTTDPRSAPKLQIHIHRLRRALDEPARLRFGPGGYLLKVLPDELDADRFETFIDEAAEIVDDEPARCVELIRKALDLWAGEPYEGLDSPELVAEGQRLSDRRLDATELLYQALLASGRDTSLVADLRDLVRRYPLRERLYALLMVALYRSDRRADALQVYLDARRTLVDELGLEPGAELQRIEQRILAGEPVELGSAAADRPVPAQLPARARGFVGREAELAEIEALAAGPDESGTLAVLSGTAGVGKTALAVSSAYRIRERFPDGQLYVDLRGYGPDRPQSPSEVLGGFLRALGLEGAAIPSDLDERAARLRSLLDGRRMLLVLDNARSVDQVRPLLPGTPSCFVIVTSRDSLTGLGAGEGAHRIALDRLSDDEATRLLRELVGPELTTGPVPIANLVDQCARLPLALRIAADLVRTRPTRGVAGLVDELADERHRLDLLDVDDTQLAVRAVFSWSYQQLSTGTARVFRMCGLHPGPDFDAYAIAALADVEPQTARRSLDTLVRAHLIDESSAARFQPHDLLRAYAREHAEATETEAERQTALERLSAYYIQTAARAADFVNTTQRHRRRLDTDPSIAAPTFPDIDAALAWLDAELPNLIPAAGFGDPYHLIQLSWVLWSYLNYGVHLQEAVDLHVRALDVARASRDRASEADCNRFLAGALSDLGRHDAASAHAEQALALYRDLDDLDGQAFALPALGSICHRRGQLRDAVRYLERRQELDRELDRPVSPITLTNLALAHGALGNHEQAFDCASQALARGEANGNRALVAHALGNLAVLSEKIGRLDDAMAYVQRMLSVIRRDGVRRLEPAALEVLGAVHRRLGEYDTSLHYHRRGLELARAAGAIDEVAEAMNGIGRTLRANGDAAAAVRHHRDALDALTEGGFRLEEAHSLAWLGDAYTDLGDADAAREHRQRALEIYRELGVAEADEVAARLRM